MEGKKFTIENGILRTQQNIKINFGRIESICGYVMEIKYFDEAVFCSYSLYNDSHFSGGINQTSSPISSMPENLQYFALKLANHKLTNK